MKIIFNIFGAAIVALFTFLAPVMANQPVAHIPDSIVAEIKSEMDDIDLSKKLIQLNEPGQARDLLISKSFVVMELEIERLHLIATTYMADGNYKDAIVIYRHILDNQPNLSKIRAELAIAYINIDDWYRADYHMRLALSDKSIPPEMVAQLRQLLYIIRSNKNWDVWFNVSASPDNNPGLTRGGSECLNFMGMLLCRQLPEPKRTFGFHTNFGGNYEFKITDRLGIKSDLAVFTSFYDNSQYNSIYLRGSTGPRYVWSDGELWTAMVLSRRFYGNREYSYSIGAQADLWQDLTDRLGLGVLVQYLSAWYDDYGKMLDGAAYSVSPKLTYIFSSSMFANFGLQLERETAQEDAYLNHKIGTSVGFGTELAYGFRIYVEPFLTFIKYDAARLTVKDYKIAMVTEKDRLYGTTLSVSNNNLTRAGFTPALVYRYTARDSNIWQREFSKHSIEIQIQRRF
ncbi:MAG: surface lipoprotein assembly modifier [Rickettsiales bacterium]|jgi:hypothetical protein|nr:surface lipoprotein assembly modifier [Rickettsiales bacterium]